MGDAVPTAPHSTAHSLPGLQCACLLPFCLAPCRLCFAAPPCLEQLAHLFLHSLRETAVGRFCLQREKVLCSWACVACMGAGQEKNCCCPNQNFTKPQINGLPKYSIMGLPPVMFKLNILPLSLQAQLPPGMTSEITPNLRAKHVCCDVAEGSY